MPDLTQTQFLEIVKESPGLWKYVDLRILAFRREGKWHNIITNCYLTSIKPRSRKLPATEHIAAWRIVRRIDQIPAMLEQLKKGSLRIENESVHYLASANSPDQIPRPYQNPGGSFQDITYRYPSESLRWTCFRYSAHGDQTANIIHGAGDTQLIDSELRMLPEPYDGMDGLARFEIGYNHPVAYDSYGAFYYVYAQFEANLVIEECTFRDGNLHYCVLAASEDVLRQTTIGIFASNESNEAIQTTIDTSSLSWSKTEFGFKLDGDIELSSCSTASVFLRIWKYVIHRHTLVDFAAGGLNPRVTVYEQFDPDLKNLRESLQVTGTRASRFEAGVSRLFRLLGFDVESLSDALSENVDAVAYSDSGRILLSIECTTGDINNKGKLGGLVTRTAEMVSAERFSEFEVTPVLATSMEAARITQSGLQAAQTDQIAVLAREDLLELLDMACVNRTLEQILEFIESATRRKHNALLMV